MGCVDPNEELDYYRRDRVARRVCCSVHAPVRAREWQHAGHRLNQFTSKQVLRFGVCVPLPGGSNCVPPPFASFRYGNSLTIQLHMRTDEAAILTQIAGLRLLCTTVAELAGSTGNADVGQPMSPFSTSPDRPLYRRESTVRSLCVTFLSVRESGL